MRERATIWNQSDRDAGPHSKIKKRGEEKKRRAPLNETTPLQAGNQVEVATTIHLQVTTYLQQRSKAVQEEEAVGVGTQRPKMMLLVASLLIVGVTSVPIGETNFAVLHM